MNDKLRWDTIAPNYENEIFDVFRSDKEKKVKRHIAKHANKKGTALDFGCGTGKALSLLAPSFKKIVAVDISQNCLEQAKELGYKNVEFGKADLASEKVNLPEVDFLFCCNVAISGNIKRNYKIIENGLGLIKKGGYGVFVLPALESASLSAQRLIQLYQMEGVKLSDIPKYDLNYLKNKDPKNVLEGIVDVEGTPTKHYLFGELYSLFTSDKFAVEAIDQLEYDWNTEFNAPPKWMRDPYPWDWIVEVKRVN